MKVSVKLKSFFNSEVFYLYSNIVSISKLEIICMSRDPAVLIARRKILRCQIKSMNVA